MTLKEIAEMMGDQQYDREFMNGQRESLGEMGIVAVYGGVGDVMILDGALLDDKYGLGDGIVHLNRDGIFVSECEDEYCPYAAKEIEKCKTITAVWHGEDSRPRWTYKIDIPHESFNVYMSGKVYCEGIMFWLEDLG